MPDVLIIAPPATSLPEALAPSPWLEMKRAIVAALESASTGLAARDDYEQVKVISPLDFSLQSLEDGHYRDPILCPFTLDLPPELKFPAQATYFACANVATMRQRVAGWQFQIGEGYHWLPIVLTAKGMLFGEVITLDDRAQGGYRQPVHLVDAQRQPLYALGQRLLRSLQAGPGVYLMQVGVQDSQIWFDRLLPFPDMPAVASVNVQTPDLFECHWRCLTGQPIRDLQIRACQTVG